jgi:hypothetical protein
VGNKRKVKENEMNLKGLSDLQKEIDDAGMGNPLKRRVAELQAENARLTKELQIIQELALDDIRRGPDASGGNLYQIEANARAALKGGE